jgi:hypothetical protein
MVFTQHPIHWVLETVSLVAKYLEHEVDHSSPQAAFRLQLCGALPPFPPFFSVILRLLIFNYFG